MKPFIAILAMLMLASCASTMPTQAEINEKQKMCDINWEVVNVASNWRLWCNYKKDPVMDCVREYRNGLDEKYNNPDTVSNMQDEDYSSVVKACNEIFGKPLTLIGQTNE